MTSTSVSAAASNHLTQNELLTGKLLTYFKQNSFAPLRIMLSVINGESPISLRIIDWFSTNYAKKNYTVYTILSDSGGGGGGGTPGKRFKVYNDYKLKLKAYSKKRFDPFCRWDRIAFPYVNNTFIQTTVGQLNFFKWAIENQVINYIEDNYKCIEADMNNRNSISKHKSRLSVHLQKINPEKAGDAGKAGKDEKEKMEEYEESEEKDEDKESVISSSSSGLSVSGRKKREELSILASSSIKKEMVEVVVTFE
jgi:hypothetical protein